MVSNQTISSPFFANMGKLSPMMLEGLMIRGGGIHIDDALGVRLGYTVRYAAVVIMPTHLLKQSMTLL